MGGPPSGSAPERNFLARSGARSPRNVPFGNILAAPRPAPRPPGAYDAAVSVLPAAPCHRCGAPLEIDVAAPTVACARCRVTTAVSQELRERAAAYLERLREVWARAIEARLQRALHRRGARVTPAFWRWFVVTALSVPVAIAAAASKVLGHLPLAVGIATVALLALCWWRFVDLFLRLAAMPSVDVAFSSSLGSGLGSGLGSELGACEPCGAPVEVPEGEVTVACAHCRATVITTPEIRRALLARARDRVVVLARMRDRAAAEHLATTTDALASFGVPGELASVTTALLLLGAAALTAAMIAALQATPSTEGHTPSGYVGVSLALFAVVLAVRFVLALVRLRRDALALAAVLGRPPRFGRAPPAR